MKTLHERIRHPGQSYRFLQFELEAFGSERHRHRQWELTWIRAGTGLRFVGDSVAPFGPGDLVLLGPQLVHTWISTPQNAGQPHAATVLQFSPELLAAEHFPEMAEATVLMNRAARGLHIGGAAHAAISQALAQVGEHAGIRGIAAVMEVVGLLVLHEASMTALASPALRLSAVDREHDRRIGRVIEWIHQHLATTLSIEAAAAVAHVSPGAFSRFFQREVGKSFTRYVNDLRCSEACLRLRASDRPIALVAHECGFETLSHFNRQFRLRHGQSPREFRHRTPLGVTAT